MQELDKQMGDLGDEQEVEKLDERMWGSDNDDDDDENESKDDKREEKGKGVDSVGDFIYLKYFAKTF